MSKIPSYPVQIFQSDEDEGYIVIVPDLPGCSAFGETQAEALRESEVAIAVWIGAAREAGNKVPAPSQLPLYKKYSGKVLLRMPQSLHGQLCNAAEREGVSLNQYMVYLLTEGVSCRSAHNVTVGFPQDQLVIYRPSGFVPVETSRNALVSNAYYQKEATIKTTDFQNTYLSYQPYDRMSAASSRTPLSDLLPYSGMLTWREN
jgi:predicted RNase H-like HicB family nuclease